MNITLPFNKIFNLFFCLGSIFLFSCGTKTETWINNDKKLPQGTVIFKGKQITVEIQVFDDFGNPALQKKKYSIVEKLLNEKNASMGLYILKNDSSGKFCFLPEAIEDSSHRKFDLRERDHELNTREDADKFLNSKIAIDKNADMNKDHVDSVAMRYVFFGGVKLSGPEFIKK